MTKFFLIFILFCNILQAQDSTTNTFYKPILEEFEKVSKRGKKEETVSVAGFSAKTLRESAGIVSLITGEEILNSGAKDVLDVIRTVPGFDISLDLLPVLTVRGNSGNEGKVLFLIDGQQINDQGIGYIFLMQRFPLHNIDKIEIIRGSGSAIYGGMAGLAVINVLTKKTSSKFEAGLNQTVGFANGGLMRNNMEFWTSSKINKNFDLQINAARLSGKISNINYFGGLNIENISNDLSSVQSDYINLGIRYKKLEIQYLFNNYFNQIPHVGNVKAISTLSSFSLKYRIDLNPKLAIYTKLSLRNQIPYAFYDAPPLPSYLPAKGKIEADVANTSDQRYLANIYGIYQINNNLQFTLGAEFLIDHSTYRNNRVFKNGENSISYSNLGAFAEVNLTSKIVNLTFGARFDKYTGIDPVVVPRLAITKSFDKFHLKALYTEAFKTPTIQNIRYSANQGIKPERFRLIEFEAGFRISDNFQINANIYDMQIQNYIIRRDAATTTFFVSFANIDGNIGTQGIEAEGKWKQKWGNISAGYSFYRVSQNQPDLAIPRASTVFGGIPAQKFTLQSSIKILPNWTFNPTFMYITNKFTLPAVVFPQNTLNYAEELHINLYSQYHHFLIKNLTLGVGCFNLLDGNFWLLSWKNDYSSGIALPWQSREIYFKMTYHLK
ncbi:MAG: TonB-dependent receptor [Bacteroidetes bacterium]|nr:MAG: TonB-dependent receptor [Bacteroidota bacterium]